MTDSYANLRKALLLSGCSVLALAMANSPSHAGGSTDLFAHNSLMISTSTYDPTKGAIASLVVGSTLPNTDTATTQAVAGNNYVTTWNNDTVDGSYGVTSPISIMEVNATTGALLQTFSVPPQEVVTSFSSKSELSLHVVSDPYPYVYFVGYALADVGALDVSNSDAVPGQDPTNPVTFAFGSDYAFARTVVQLDRFGNFWFTPTIAYGGNNGRAALQDKNGLYYTVGNANNGNAKTFGSGNGTNPDVTETTGLEVVQPINAQFASVAPATSAEVDPLLDFTFSGKADKPGKDDNFRGLTDYKGSLYFTKGSGSNGIDTVYTVPLPTLANAASTTINIVPGFPTDSAKSTGGDYTPFSTFFADPKTMYVTDEGSGNSTDTSSHAGLEKWSLVNGTWQLDYVLTAGLIGTVDSNLTGPAGQYPDVTTVGLRDLTGVLNGDGTVTLWAVTSTSSASGDNGADPNKVVKIVDLIEAKTVTAQVAQESFQVLMGPTYGTVYRGVAYLQ